MQDPLWIRLATKTSCKAGRVVLVATHFPTSVHSSRPAYLTGII